MKLIPRIAIGFVLGCALIVHWCDRSNEGRSLLASHPRTVRELAATLGELQERGIVEYRNQDWCRVLVRIDEAHMDSSHPTTCMFAQRDAKPFDAEAGAAHESVARLLDGSGAKVAYFTLHRGEDGSLRGADFNLDGSWAYHSYEYRRDGEPAPEVHHRRSCEQVEREWWYCVED